MKTFQEHTFHWPGIFSPDSRALEEEEGEKYNITNHKAIQLKKKREKIMSRKMQGKKREIH